MASNGDERDLIARAQRGDAAAMETLLARHELRVYRFGLRMCGSEDAAREVLQQTLITAFQSLRAFRAEAQLSTLLFQIARSVCGKLHRQGAGRAAPLDSDEAQAVADGHDSPEGVTAARELGEVLQVAISALALPQREALVLRDVEGLTAEEAAAVLGIEVANLKSRLHRARAELRRHLSVLLEPVPVGAECGALSGELSAFVTEDIDRATCEKIEAHLAGCPQCAAACESLKRSVSLCRSIPGNEVPGPIRAAVRKALRAAVWGA